MNYPCQHQHHYRRFHLHCCDDCNIPPNLTQPIGVHSALYVHSQKVEAASARPPAISATFCVSYLKTSMFCCIYIFVVLCCFTSFFNILLSLCLHPKIPPRRHLHIFTLPHVGHRQDDKFISLKCHAKVTDKAISS